MATIIRDKIKQPEGKDFKLLDSIDVEHIYTDENGDSQVTSVKEFLDDLSNAVKNNEIDIPALDDRYYTETEIDTKIDEFITNLTNGTTVVKEAEHAGSANSAIKADSATNADSATKAIQDANGNVITSTYETKTDAATKLAEAKSYADSIKNDLLNGAGEAYDTLKELGNLIDENQDAIEALEIIATNKADKDHLHDDRYYTQEQIDSMEFITVDDINEICGTTIYMASEVKF